MAFFADLEGREVPVDFAFIDGNHDYAYAYFDLASAAKLITPGGIVVMDNIEQPGPYWAAVDFLRLNPEWSEIGHSIRDFTPFNPFDPTRASYPDSPFAILQAPQDFVIQSRTIATGQLHYSHHCLGGVRLEMAKPAPKGTLHAQFFLRGFLPNHNPDQVRAFAKIDLDGEHSAELKIDPRIETTLGNLGINIRHRWEAAFFWQPRGHNEPLRLKHLPVPFPS